MYLKVVSLSNDSFLLFRTSYRNFFFVYSFQTKMEVVGLDEDTTPKFMTLKSKEDTSFQVSIQGAKCSNVLKTAMENDNENEITLDRVKHDMLQLCVKYMEIHATQEPKLIQPPLPYPCNLRDLMIPEDVDLIDNLPVLTLFELITCANYMDIPGLMNILSVKIASLIKGKTTEEIKKTFGIDEITREEEEQVKEEFKDLLDLYSDK